jgi:hypothetical protein
MCERVEVFKEGQVDIANDVFRFKERIDQCM